MKHRSTIFRPTWLLAGFFAITASACYKEPAGPPAVVTARPNLSRIPVGNVPASQRGMGPLDQYALRLVYALQNDRARIALAAALKDPANHGVGINLTDCADPVVAALSPAVPDGGTRGSSWCAQLKSRGDFILYMDPVYAARWDGSTVPIVTALVNPQARVPAHLMGYRSPTVLIDIGADPALRAAILVILPSRHPSAIKGGSR